MYIVDWDQFWLTLAAWWFFVDWDEIWLSVGAWFAFAGFHLTIFEFVGDLDDTPPRGVSVRAAYHDHAFCARLPAAEAPAPAAASYPYLASYAVFLLSFASVRLLSSFSTRRNNEHEK